MLNRCSCGLLATTCCGQCIYCHCRSVPGQYEGTFVGPLMPERPCCGVATHVSTDRCMGSCLMEYDAAFAHLRPEGWQEVDGCDWVATLPKTVPLEAYGLAATWVELALAASLAVNAATITAILLSH